MADQIEYVVTLKSVDDLDNFYNDMETEGGDLYIPNRAVGVYKRRPLSRNTHYMLTADEAETVRQDPRVEGVEIADIIRQAIIPLYTVTGDFEKSTSVTANDLNWAHLRCTEGSNRANWGLGGTTTNQADSVSITSSGKNVDVVIIDGHIDPTHPEYLDRDGNLSRVNQFDWYTLNNTVTSIDDDGATLLSGTYVYTPYVDGVSDRTDDNNHGAHVAGTVAGALYGWAQDANIYNISPYATNPNNLDSLAMWDYIRAFHSTKAVNSTTGVKNPTICNGSYGSAIRWDDTGLFGKVTRAFYRGVDSGSVPTGLSSAQLIAAGIYDNGSATPLIPYYSTAIAADITDAIADGIIVVAAAGNEYFRIDEVGGPDYNNTFVAAYLGTSYSWYTHRGTTPGAVPGVICVGAASNYADERKAYFSNIGPRIDIFAPGQAILSSLNTGVSTDPRNSNYYIAKYQGTSMASPEVCGVLACALETYPNMNQSEALAYLLKYASTNQMSDTGTLDASDQLSLQGAPNRYLVYHYERPVSGNTFPKLNVKDRPTSGAVYPRSRIRRKG